MCVREGEGVCVREGEYQDNWCNCKYMYAESLEKDSTNVNVCCNERQQVERKEIEGSEL